MDWLKKYPDLSAQEVVTDVTEGKKHCIDILAEVKINGEDGRVLIHVELQAYRQRNFDRRMFKYFCRLYEKHNKKVLPIAVFSHDSLVEEKDSDEVTFSFFKVMRFHFLKVQLKQIPWRTYIHKNNPVAAALLSKMHYTPQERVQVKLQFLRMLLRMELDPARMQLLAGFFDQYMVLTEKEELELQKQMSSRLAPKEVRRVMEITTSWHEKGREEGLQQGLQQLQQGIYTILSKQIQKLFGVIPPDLEERLSKMSVVQLETLADKILELKSIEDLRQTIASNKN